MHPPSRTVLTPSGELETAPRHVVSSALEHNFICINNRKCEQQYPGFEPATFRSWFGHLDHRKP